MEETTGGGSERATFARALRQDLAALDPLSLQVMAVEVYAQLVHRQNGRGVACVGCRGLAVAHLAEKIAMEARAASGIVLRVEVTE